MDADFVPAVPMQKKYAKKKYQSWKWQMEDFLPVIFRWKTDWQHFKAKKSQDFLALSIITQKQKKEDKKCHTHMQNEEK